MGRASRGLSKGIEKEASCLEGCLEGSLETSSSRAVAGKLASLSDVIGCWLGLRLTDNLGAPANI